MGSCGLHTGYGHWITISTYGCELGVIDIFDSTTPAVTSAIQQQIATILCLPTSIKEVTLRYFGLIIFNFHNSCQVACKKGNY